MKLVEPFHCGNPLSGWASILLGQARFVGRRSYVEVVAGLGRSMPNILGSRVVVSIPRTLEVNVRMAQGQETCANGDSEYPRFFAKDMVVDYVGGSRVDMDV